MSNTKNPYAYADGTPVDGKEVEFYQWESEQYQKQLDAMPAGQRKEQEAADARLADRMNS